MTQRTLSTSDGSITTLRSNTVNHRIILHSRPVGAPTADNFHLDEDIIPVPSEGQVLLRTLYLSLDPYMRGRMSDMPSYTAPVTIGDVMIGGTISSVVNSNHPEYKTCLLYTSPSPRDGLLSRMPSS